MARPPKADNSNHYVDNKKFYEEMTKYYNKYHEAKEQGKEPPRASNYIGECIWLIATRLSTNRNFINYTYREEMIGDAIENCLRYLHNFNPEKTNNPFAYFTQISYYAFLRRIEKEQKQSYIRWKSIEDAIVSNTLVDLPGEDQEHFNVVIQTLDHEKLASMSERYEKKKGSAKQKKGSAEKLNKDRMEDNNEQD